MVRVLVLYDEEPDATAYVGHAELCRQVPGGTFRHGKVFGSPMGEPAHRYFAEWEFPDLDAFKAAASSAEFRVAQASSPASRRSVTRAAMAERSDRTSVT